MLDDIVALSDYKLSQVVRQLSQLVQENVSA